ncbi:MAG: tetratricopeptide repeat protein, partial [Desulfosarcina sp.]
NHDEGIRHLERAIELEPNGADFQAHMGMALYLADRSQEAVQALLRAIRLNPNPPSWYLHNLAVAYNFVDNFEEAIFWGEKAVKLDPKSLLGRYILCAIYSSAGRMEDAKREASEVLKIKPNFSVSTVEKTNPLKNESVKKRYFDSLRKAGLPEYPPNEKAVKPSIAVLPFDNMSNDPEQEYFSDGIAEDIITDLSKISGLIVIARNSSFTYKGKSVNAQQIGRELQVSYLLEGSVRKAGEKVRINAQLIDASSGHHLWADRYDGRMDDVFALQDKITHKIISALALKLTANEEKAVSNKGTYNLQAYDSFLRGWQGYRMMTKQGFAEAKTHLEKAVELDPEFARAYAALAVLYWKAIQTGLGLTDHSKRNAVLAKPQLLLKKAMTKPSALAHGLMSQLYLLRYQREEALAEIERAVAIDPNDPELYTWMSNILWFVGESGKAAESARMALRLDPNNPTAYLFQLGRINVPDGNLEESLQVLERAKNLNPALSGSIGLFRSIIYGIQNRNEEACKEYEIFLKNRQSPVRNLNDILLYLPFADPKKLDRIADALIKAGVPGNPTDYYRIFKENRIHGQEIKTLLFGRKITGIAMSTGKQFWWEWSKSGDFNLDLGSFQDTGKSWVEGDIFFIQFQKLFSGLPYGSNIYGNPDGSSENKNRYLIVSDIGSITPFIPTE